MATGGAEASTVPSSIAAGLNSLLNPDGEKRPRPPPDAPAKRNRFTSAKGPSPRRAGPGNNGTRLAEMDVSTLEKLIFFLGVSQAFLKELAPLFELRGIDKKRGEAKPAPAGTASAVVRSSKEEQREVFKQFESPQYDGLFLSLQDSSAEWEVFYEDHRLVTLHGECVIGQEVALGVNDRPIFTVLVAASPKQEFWFLPRLQLLSLVKRPEFANDFAVLSRASDSLTNVWLKDHLLRFSHGGRGRFRLFLNMDREFHDELIRSMTAKVFNAGQNICTAGEASQSAFCVFQGEANVIMDDESIGVVSHGTSTKNWAAWWGLLECSGACKTRPAGLVALNECLVLVMSPEDYRKFTVKHPHECGLFDKVAHKHASLVAGGIQDPWRSMPVLCSLSLEFRRSLEKRSKLHVYGVGETVVEDMAICETIMVVARGFASWRIGAQSLACRYLGELPMLGVSQTFPAKAICDTVCDIREISLQDFSAILAVFPEDEARLHKVAKDYAHTRKMAATEFRRTPLFDSPDAARFVEAIVEALSDQIFLPGQVITFQGAYARQFTVIIQGEVEVKVEGADPVYPATPLVLDELALLRSFETCAANVKAISSTHCLCASTEALRNFVVINVFPEVAARMRKEIPVDETGVAIESASQNLLARCKRRQPLKKGRSSLFVAATPSGRSTFVVPAEVHCYAEGRKLLDYADVWSDFLKTSNAMFVDRCSQMLRCIVFLEGQVVSNSGDRDPRLILVVEGRLLIEGLQAADGGKAGSPKQNGALTPRTSHVADQATVHVTEGENKQSWVALGEIKAGQWIVQVFMDLHREDQGRPVHVRALGVVRAFELSRADLLDICEDFPKEESRLDEVLHRCQVEQSRQKFKHVVRAVRAHADFAQKMMRKPAGLLPSSKLVGFKDAARRRDAALARGDVGRVSVRLSLAYGQTAPPEVLLQRASLARKSICGQHLKLDDLSKFEDKPIQEESEGASVASSTVESTPRRLPVQEQIAAWVQRRTLLIHDAKETASAMSLRRTGDFAEILPGREGWRASLTGPGTPFAAYPELPSVESPGTDSDSLGGMTLKLRTAKTASVYGRPVWSEVYGGPIAMRPLLRKQPRQPKTAR